jgi:GH43 family beta-xylosidase
MIRLAGEPVVVARASHDWQRFEAGRIIYGARYDWHTIEGPCVRKRHGRYWCLYSAGRWENQTYGVDWAVAGSVTGPWRSEAHPEGSGLLRTIPGLLVGPGHNSVVEGTNGEDHIVYHAWDPSMTARRTFIEPLNWTPRGPVLSAR